MNRSSNCCRTTPGAKAGPLAVTVAAVAKAVRMVARAVRVAKARARADKAAPVVKVVPGATADKGAVRVVKAAPAANSAPQQHASDYFGLVRCGVPTLRAMEGVPQGVQGGNRVTGGL
jgi:hypothetical protein